MHLETRLANLENMRSRGVVPDSVAYTLETARSMLQAAQRSWLPWRRRNFREAAEQCLEHCEEHLQDGWAPGPEFG